MNKHKAIVLIPVLVFGLMGAGCDVDRAEREPVYTPPAAPPPAAPEATGNITVADIISNWTNYEGKTVTVVADVEEVLGPRAFMLDEDSPLDDGVDDDLLVLSPKAGSLANIDDERLNDNVRVTGVVRRFVVADIERELGWDLDPRLEAKFKDKPVLIATSVERVQ